MLSECKLIGIRQLQRNLTTVSIFINTPKVICYKYNKRSVLKLFQTTLSLKNIAMKIFHRNQSLWRFDQTRQMYQYKKKTRDLKKIFESS